MGPVERESYRRVVGLCHPVRDAHVVLGAREIGSLLAETPLRAGVSFPGGEAFQGLREAVVNRHPGQALLAPGGPVSNTLHAIGTALHGYPRPFALDWMGPAAVAYDYVEADPLASLRQVGVRVTCLPSALVGPCESVCVTEEESGETAAIAVGPRPPLDVPRGFARGGDLLLLALRHLPRVAERFDRADPPHLALVLADHERMTEAETSCVESAAAQGLLRFVFGRYEEFDRLRLIGQDRVHPLLKDTEVVATCSREPVAVFAPGGGVPFRFAVRPPDARGRFLGAGDAYTGGYLAARLTGSGFEDAHRVGGTAAEAVCRSFAARAPSPTDLTSLFGATIARSGGRADADFFQRVRLTCGLTVVTCGQTGVDQAAQAAAGRYGLAAFAVMPRGRRTEAEDGVPARIRTTDATVLELDSPSYRYCTWANVFTADGTILADFAGTEGSEETRKACAALGRPLLEIADLDVERLPQIVARWCRTHGVRTLHVGGNRASTLPAERIDVAEAKVDMAVRAAAASLARMPLPAFAPMAASVSALRREPPLPTPSEPRTRWRLAIPRLSEVSTAFVEFLTADKRLDRREFPREELLWTLPAGSIVLARSYDIIQMLDSGYVDGGLVGTDMVGEFGPGRYMVVGMSNFFNCLLGEIHRDGAAADSGRPVLAQYPRVAAAMLEPAGQVVAVKGAGESWLATGEFRYLVDTWRTGRTAVANGAALRRVYASCSLAAIAPAGEPENPAVRLAAEFLDWLSVGGGRLEGSAGDG